MALGGSLRILSGLKVVLYRLQKVCVTLQPYSVTGFDDQWGELELAIDFLELVEQVLVPSIPIEVIYGIPNRRFFGPSCGRRDFDVLFPYRTSICYLDAVLDTYGNSFRLVGYGSKFLPWGLLHSCASRSHSHDGDEVNNLFHIVLLWFSALCIIHYSYEKSSFFIKTMFVDNVWWFI